MGKDRKVLSETRSIGRTLWQFLTEALFSSIALIMSFVLMIMMPVLVTGMIGQVLGIVSESSVMDMVMWGSGGLAFTLYWVYLNIRVQKRLVRVIRNYIVSFMRKSSM